MPRPKPSTRARRQIFCCKPVSELMRRLARGVTIGIVTYSAYFAKIYEAACGCRGERNYGWGSVFKKLPNHNGVRTGPAVSQGLSETLRIFQKIWEALTYLLACGRRAGKTSTAVEPQACPLSQPVTVAQTVMMMLIARPTTLAIRTLRTAYQP